MSNLVVIGFDNEHKAEEVRLTLLKLQRDYLIDLDDAVVAVKNQDGKVKLHQIHDLTATGAVSGGFWGLLIGTLFLSPLLGTAVGAAAGAASGALSDVGISNDFMKELASTLKPGSSALFVLVRKATPDIMEILLNKEAIAVNQDPLGRQGVKVRDDGDAEVWSKVLQDGSRAVVLFNRGKHTANIRVRWTEVGYASHLKATVRDLWKKKDLGAFSGSFAADVPSHGVVMVTVAP